MTRERHDVELGLEALRLTARGIQGKAAAAVLGVTENIVHNRLKRLYRVLGARSAPHAIVIAAIDGLLTREDLKAAYENRRPNGEGEEG